MLERHGRTTSTVWNGKVKNVDNIRDETSSIISPHRPEHETKGAKKQLLEQRDRMTREAAYDGVVALASCNMQTPRTNHTSNHDDIRTVPE